MLRLLELVHERWGKERRAQVLARRVAALLPPAGRVLDVGVGCGRVATLVREVHPGLEVVGVEVQLPRRPPLPVALFDGRWLPFGDATFAAAMVVDVLHHARDPAALLAEVVRVSPAAVILKDHLREGLAARATLAFMDRVGNRRFGVASPGVYLSRQEWRHLFAAVGVRVCLWEERLGLYPPPLGWLFGRSLHFLALLGRR